MEVKKIKVVQYKQPSPVYEWLGYVGTVLLLVATILYPGTPLFPAMLAGGLLYWNYTVFDLMRKYVRYVNATEISNLLQEMALAEENKHKDGTISDSEGLTKEPVDEQEEG